MVSLDELRDAQAALAGRIHRTPTFTSRTLAARTGGPVFLKAELLQKTGSFKVRGALNKIRALSADQKARGFIAVSAGNHAAALGWAASQEGARATVVMPANASRSKVDASRGYGTDVVLHGSVFDAFEKMEALRAAHGLTLVHPYDDPHVIAGQGTVGLEVIEDVPDADVVVVPVGGGGLISGIAAAVKALRPTARVYGVEPTGAAALTAALEAGHPVRLERVQTIADGLAAPITGALVLEHVRALVDDVVLLSDDEIAAGLRFLLERAKLLAEPAGAAAVAALLAGRIPLRPGDTAVAIVSGGNIDLQRVKELLD
ncbi:MAG: pyridoxal-phosphate dependent enzyme [Gemmatimonadetes bacterium]|nr:pyridoxal-phosphate dependent enzyme [Gemmatimonadota bacterium]